MPLFRGRAKPTTRELSDIVVDMLADNVPEKQILNTLVQTGLSKVQARGVLDAAKKQFGKHVAATVGKRTESVLEQKKGELSNYMEAQFIKIKKDVQLQLDLQAMETKKYTDKQIKSGSIDVQHIKSEVAGLKAQIGTTLRRVQSDVDSLKFTGTTKRALFIALLVIGLIMILFALYFVPAIYQYLISRAPLDFTLVLYIASMLVMMVIGIVCIKFGIAIYMEKQHKEVIFPWEKPKEEKK